MLRFVIASSNAGKCVEVGEQAEDFGMVAVSASEIAQELGLAAPPDVVEDADTYVGNAALKAIAYASWCNLPTLADDSGLEVDALSGEPGLYTARYAGPGCTPADNIEKLLKNLSGEKNRKARFCCSLSFSFKESVELEVTSYLEGQIAEAPFGDGGFGYDPVFIPEGYTETLAELKAKRIPVQTHRVKALTDILPSVKSYLEQQF